MIIVIMIILIIIVHFIQATLVIPIIHPIISSPAITID